MKKIFFALLCLIQLNVFSFSKMQALKGFGAFTSTALPLLLLYKAYTYNRDILPQAITERNLLNTNWNDGNDAEKRLTLGRYSIWFFNTFDGRLPYSIKGVHASTHEIQDFFNDRNQVPSEEGATPEGSELRFGLSYFKGVITRSANHVAQPAEYKVPLALLGGGGVISGVLFYNIMKK